MGIKIFYDNVMDKLDLNRYPSDFTILVGSADEIYPLTNLQVKSKNVFASVYPSLTEDKAEIATYIYHITSGSKVIRGGTISGHNFVNSGAIKYQVYVDHETSDNIAAYQDFILKNKASFTGSPGVGAGSYELRVFENITQLITVSNAAQFTPGRWIRESTTRYAKILKIVSATQMMISVPDDGAGFGAASVVYETYSPQATTAQYDSGISDTISAVDPLGSPTTVTISGAALTDYSGLITELNNGLSGTTASLASDNSYIRIQSNLAGSPGSSLKILPGVTNDILTAIDSSNGALLGRQVDSFTRSTDIITPYSDEFASATWSDTFWSAGDISSTLLDFANDIVYDLGSPSIGTAFAGTVCFYVDSTVVDDIQIGRLTFGKGFVPRYSFSKNYDFEVFDGTRQIRTEGGSLKSTGQPWFRRATLPFSAINEADKNVLTDLMRTVGMRQDLAITMFPDDPSIERRHMYTFVGRLVSPIRLKEIQHGWFSTILQVEETN